MRIEMKEIKLTQGKVALVDDNDFRRLNQYKWGANYCHGGWRAMRKIRKSNGKWKTQLMHRTIMNVPKGLQVDHINHNGLDNQKHNLRICTCNDNQHNRKSQKGSSKYKGIYWNNAIRKWHTRIQLNNRRIHIGYYIDEIAAALAYDKRAKELFGEFAYLNFGE